MEVYPAEVPQVASVVSSTAAPLPVTLNFNRSGSFGPGAATPSTNGQSTPQGLYMPGSITPTGLSPDADHTPRFVIDFDYPLTVFLAFAVLSALEAHAQH